MKRERFMLGRPGRSRAAAQDKGAYVPRASLAPLQLLAIGQDDRLREVIAEARRTLRGLEGDGSLCAARAWKAGRTKEEGMLAVNASRPTRRAGQ